MSSQEQPKKEKPREEWKLAGEAKKLKKEQDRKKEKEKPEQAASTHSKKDNEAKKIEYAKEKKETKEETVQKPIDKPTKAAEQVLKKEPNKDDQKTATETDILERILSRRWKRIRDTPMADVFTNKLLEHTSKYIGQDDSILIGSKHDVCLKWFQRNVCEVVDVWNLSDSSTRKDNVIRTRFEDVGYFSHTITKIVCGATAIFQNGVVLSQPGSLFLAILAKQFRIPFIVFCQSQRYCDTSLLEGDLKENEGVTYDIINPELISMLITEAGPIAAISVSTLIAQMDKV